MSAQYKCASQQRVLKVMLCLFGHEIEGLSPGQVAKLAGITASQVTRDLWNLEDVGLVERLPSGDKVRISPLLGRKALAVLHTFDRASRQISDLTARYTKPADGQILNEIFGK